MMNRGLIALAFALTLGLAGCVPPPPRQTVVYHEGERGQQSNEGAQQNNEGAQQSNYSGRYCHVCGTVRDIDQVAIRQSSSGGGAVLGAIIGGVIGNQFGGGSGKAAATAVGVVGGAVAGNAIEENNARANSGNAWRFRVELDDGRWATVTQANNPGFHPGDRVVINGDHLEWKR